MLRTLAATHLVSQAVGLANFALDCGTTAALLVW